MSKTPPFKISLKKRGEKIEMQKIVNEIIDHLIANNGPDNEGLGHPFQKRLLYKDLNNGLSIAKERGFCKNIEPYHFHNIIGLYKNALLVDKIVEKKIDQLLKEKYKNDLVQLITKTCMQEIFSPLIDYVDGKEYRINVRKLGELVGNKKYSPFAIVAHYLKVKGLEKRFNALKPYHFKITSVGTYNDPKMVNEVLEKKIDQLLNQKYKGNLVSLIKETSLEELSSPLVDYLDGQPVNVSMVRVGKKVSGKKESPFCIVSHYIRFKGLEKRFKGLRKYHFKRSSLKTYNDPQNVDKILVKKIDQLLNEKYRGDLVSLIKDTSLGELSSPLIEYLDGQPITISTVAVEKKFRGQKTGLFSMVTHYMKLKNIDNKFKELRPYHFKSSANGTYNDPKIVNEVLRKKMDQLLKTRYQGNQKKMKEKITLNELLEPLIDYIDGKPLPVSMVSVRMKIRKKTVHKGQDIKTAMLEAYFKERYPV